MQRLRIRYSRGEEIKFISHLDLMRLWERAFRRAEMPLAYSEGFSPHPKMALAAPLPVGVTSEAELMDVVVNKFVSPHWFSASVSRQLPPGIEITGVYPVGMTLPSLQAQVRFVEYQVEIDTEKTRAAVELAVSELLSLKSLSWEHHRDTGQRTYDLRALIGDLSCMEWKEGCCTLGMRLKCDSSGSGRPEQVVSALGFVNYPKSIHRTNLILVA